MRYIQATVLPRATLQIFRVSMERTKNWNQMQSTTATNIAIRHTMTNSSGKQQHCSCSNSSIETHRATVAEIRQESTNTYRYSRTSGVYSIITPEYNISSPGIRCYETIQHTPRCLTKRDEKKTVHPPPKKKKKALL